MSLANNFAQASEKAGISLGCSAVGFSTQFSSEKEDLSPWI